MKAILKCVAEAYLNRYKYLGDFCFLFPNKRCITFFRNYLKETGYRGKNPTLLTISDFIKKLAGKEEAGKIDAIFTLYKCYLDINSRSKDGRNMEEPDFESFRVWGETILADFNTIDQNLADPAAIFKNVKELRKLSSNFLNDEQREVLRDYFGIEESGDTSTFWKTFEEEKMTSLKEKFLNLWQILGELHTEFTARLASENTATVGGLYRLAAERLQEEGKKLLPWRKIVVFGFNALNGAEWQIFAEMRDMEGETEEEFADFIWDATGPVLTSELNSASKFIHSNQKHFPTAPWILESLKESNTDKYPDITIISSPSDTFQTKIAGGVLSEYRNSNPKKVKESETALILPDETLLVNTLYSIPETIRNINLTMGYSFRQTGVATFMSLLRRLYGNMRERSNDKVFFHKDLKLILSHPYSYIIFGPKEIDGLMVYMNKYHKIIVGLKEICNYLSRGEEYFNMPGPESPPAEMFEYLQLLFDNIIEKMSESPEKADRHKLELSSIDEYRKKVTELRVALVKHGIKLSQKGVLYQVDRLISQLSVVFEGEPLAGLQIMGTLETRGLDFRDVVIVSMNEGMLPMRSKGKSFLPENLRKEHHLPPARYSEEIFSYYFYRLISRAERVTLIYDGRTGGGLMSGGESRYLLQLRHLSKDADIKEKVFNFRLQSMPAKDSSIEKTGEIFSLIEKFYTGDGEERKNLSASSLNTYRECQVKFFLNYIAGLDTDPQQKEFIDPITVGNILHEVMMELYLPEKLQRKLLKSPVRISRELIEEKLKGRGKIKSMIKEKINRDYYKLEKEDLQRSLPASAEMISRQLQFQVEEILKHDMQLTPFELHGCEIAENIKVETPSGRKVNFRFAIDRLDRIPTPEGERLRIVDYKTGSRKREAESLEEVFEGTYSSEQIFQLFIYAWLLDMKDVGGKEDVMTEIYYVPDFLKSQNGLPKIGKKEVINFKEYRDEFKKGVEEMIESLFESEIFEMPGNPGKCLYCEFRRLCGK